jgi:uncharacterized membrane protein/NAD(P)H-hydrate repair Nnr-like enzyme with NAD(P)H-hydrate epimerase domain
MRVSFIFPATLWLLLVLIPLWALTLALPRRLSPPRFWASLLLRTALLAALVLALAGPQLVRPADHLATIFLLDRSDSVAPSARGQAEAFVREALGAARPGDQAAVVAFGANALVEQPPTAERALGPLDATPDPSRTNIQGALQLGLALLPADANKRLVLLSDGSENAGDARAAALQAAAQGVPIDYVDLRVPSPGEALLAGIAAPASVRQGQEFELVAVVESTVAQPARLRIFGDDALIQEQDVQLQAGENRFSVKVGAQGQGFRRYRAEIEPQADGYAQNNRAEALVHVGGAPHVLLVEGQPGEGQPLKDALAAAQVDAELIAPGTLPGDLSALSAYDAVVLINVPARALPPAALESLPAYVRDLGRGLIMIGGDQSFGVGGYARTPIEQALPVSMEVRDQLERPNLALVFILDKSSSMDACHCRGPSRDTDGFFGGRPKIDIGKEAVVQAVAALNPHDTVGVVAFDENAYLAFPPQRGPHPDAVQNAIAPIAPKGPTNVYAGLQLAEEALKQIDARVKHAILLTDGWARGGDPLEIARRMHDQGITLSVVAEGQGSAPYLQQLADAGGGRYFPVEKIEDVPQIFLQETINAASNALIETPFTPRYALSSPILRGLEHGLPALYGYNTTTARQTASVALLGPDDAPILAQWQYGLGRAVAWTSDLKGQWARDWVRWPEFPRFAAQLIGWVLPSGPTSGLATELRTQGTQTVLKVTARDPRGRPAADMDLHATIVGPQGFSQAVPLPQVAPGIYQAAIASPPQGTYLVQIAGSRGGQTIVQETAGLVVPYSPEYSADRDRTAVLEALAQISSGKRLSQPAQAFEHNLSGAGQAQEIGLLLLLLALLLLPIDIGVRRLFASSGR